eukprot:SAG31_NODE_571_length_13998_cov_4.346212_4_plen_161_part_00
MHAVLKLRRRGTHRAVRRETLQLPAQRCTGWHRSRRPMPTVGSCPRPWRARTPAPEIRTRCTARSARVPECRGQAAFGDAERSSSWRLDKAAAAAKRRRSPRATEIEPGTAASKRIRNGSETLGRARRRGAVCHYCEGRASRLTSCAAFSRNTIPIHFRC